MRTAQGELKKEIHHESTKRRKHEKNNNIFVIFKFRVFVIKIERDFTININFAMLILGLESAGWAAPAEAQLTGRIFGDMLFELFAPQGLKGMTAAIQGVEFGGIGPLAAQIAPFNRGSCNTGILPIFEFSSHELVIDVKNKN